jgi:hypothetical protein
VSARSQIIENENHRPKKKKKENPRLAYLFARRTAQPASLAPSQCITAGRRLPCAARPSLAARGACHRLPQEPAALSSLCFHPGQRPPLVLPNPNSRPSATFAGFAQAHGAAARARPLEEMTWPREEAAAAWLRPGRRARVAVAAWLGPCRALRAAAAARAQLHPLYPIAL